MSAFLVGVVAGLALFPAAIIIAAALFLIYMERP